MNILVAGGAGFIGSQIAISLAESFSDCHVIVLDNLTRRGSELNINKLTARGIKFVHGDIRCREDLDPETLPCDVVIDCSAEPSVLAGYTASQKLIQSNLIGTIHLLELARLRKAGFIFVSTSRVYPVEPLSRLSFIETEQAFALDDSSPSVGLSSHGISEQFPLEGYRSLYGATKLSGELMVEEYRHAFKMKAVVNRCGVVTGPGQLAKPDQGIFAYWMAAHVFGKPLKYIGFDGSGKQVRDLLHVDDLAELIAIQIESLDRVDGNTFNVGGGSKRALSLLQTTHACREITGRHIDVVASNETRPGDIPWYVTDARKVEEMLGWKPKRSAIETLRDIHDWMIAEKDSLTSVLL